MIYYFEPLPCYTIWGGDSCNKFFNFTEKFSRGVGQALAFSAQKNAGTICLNGNFRGMTLLRMWEEYPELFGQQKYSNDVFPLIISLVAPEDDLSIQVHPDAAHAAKLGYQTGKNEAWYFIRCDKNSSIVYGHNSKDEVELRQNLTDGKWESILNRLPVSVGDFVYIPSGYMHALCKNSIVYEVQQSTDITYRLYDYDRKTESGKGRELHLDKALETLHYHTGNDKNMPPVPFQSMKTDHLTETTFISNKSFTVTRLEVSGEAVYRTIPYRLATVVDGIGFIDGKSTVVGESFLIPVNTQVSLSGKITVMMTTKEL